jgi:adenine-specific DNA-methyltransferase
LFDEVFEESNFVGTVPRKTGAGAAATRGEAELRDLKDYLLIYKQEDTAFRKKIVGQKEFPLSDNLGDYRLGQFQASGSDATQKARPNLYYPIYLLGNGDLTTKQIAKI